jgi:hypothetical protein
VVGVCGSWCCLRWPELFSGGVGDVCGGWRRLLAGAAFSGGVALSVTIQ